MSQPSVDKPPAAKPPRTALRTTLAAVIALVGIGLVAFDMGSRQLANSGIACQIGSHCRSGHGILSVIGVLLIALAASGFAFDKKR